MSRYSKATIWLFLLFFSLTVGVCFLSMGISGMKKIKKEYNVPVYIVKTLSLSEEDGYYTITGEIKNRTNEEVKIDILYIRLDGDKNKTHYIAYTEIKNIIVPANSLYEIYIPNKAFYYDSYRGGRALGGELTKARIYGCQIDGKSVELKWWDGRNYIGEATGTTRSNFAAICIGVICFLIAIGIIVCRIKNKIEFTE